MVWQNPENVDTEKLFILLYVLSLCLPVLLFSFSWCHSHMATHFSKGEWVSLEDACLGTEPLRAAVSIADFRLFSLQHKNNFHKISAEVHGENLFFSENRRVQNISEINSHLSWSHLVQHQLDCFSPTHSAFWNLWLLAIK